MNSTMENVIKGILERSVAGVFSYAKVRKVESRAEGQEVLITMKAEELRVSLFLLSEEKLAAWLARRMKSETEKMFCGFKSKVVVNVVKRIERIEPEYDITVCWDVVRKEAKDYYIRPKSPLDEEALMEIAERSILQMFEDADSLQCTNDKSVLGDGWVLKDEFKSVLDNYADNKENEDLGEGYVLYPCTMLESFLEPLADCVIKTVYPERNIAVQISIWRDQKYYPDELYHVSLDFLEF